MQRCWGRACKGSREYEYEYMRSKLDLTITSNSLVVPSAVYCTVVWEQKARLRCCIVYHLTKRGLAPHAGTRLQPAKVEPIWQRPLCPPGRILALARCATTPLRQPLLAMRRVFSLKHTRDNNAVWFSRLLKSIFPLLPQILLR